MHYHSHSHYNSHSHSHSYSQYLQPAHVPLLTVQAMVMHAVMGMHVMQWLMQMMMSVAWRPHFVSAAYCHQQPQQQPMMMMMMMLDDQQQMHAQHNHQLMHH